MCLLSRMKLPLVATRLGIIAFKLMIVAMVALSILPLVTGGLGIDMDNEDEGEMTFDDGVIHAEMPITVRNDGYFDINDLTVSFTFMNEDGDVLTSSDGEPMDIPAGKETEVSIGLTLDLNDLDYRVRSDLIFNGTDMKFDAKISAKYILDMVQLSVEAGSDMGWGPFISDLQVEEWNAQPLDEGGDKYVLVPFSFRADDMLEGFEVYVETEYWDGDGFASDAGQTVHLSHQVYETAKVPLSQEAYDRLINGTANATVRTTLFILDCSTYDEGHLTTGGGGGDPIYNLQLQMGSSYLQDMGGSYLLMIPFSYQTAPAYQGEYASAFIEYSDLNGFYTNINQMIYLEENGWVWAQIWLSQDAYDAVQYDDEIVHVKVTMYYQYWTMIDEQDYHEPWGVGP